MNSAFFENETLRIVSFEKQHLTSQYVGWLNDPEVVRFSEQRHTTHTIKSCISYFNQQKKSDSLFLAIEFKSPNKTIQHLGNIGVFIDRKNAYGDISILIGEKEFWGTGTAYHSIKGILPYLFDKEKLNLISCGAASCNLGMIRVMEKLGMNPKMTFPDRFIINNKTYDLIQGWLKSS
jgi:RimJ/RimL family protein N-acetyltransferase